MEKIRPIIGMGACLVGRQVRYDGEGKRKNPHIEKLREHAEGLQHIRGYLERARTQQKGSLIMQYKSWEVPLVVPLTLLVDHFSRHASNYMAKQVYMQPYPEQLRLSNII